MRLRFVLSELAISLRRNLLMLFAVVVITAFSLFLFGIALLVQRQVNLSQHYWYQRLQVSVYLCAEHSTNPNCPTAATPEQVQQVEQTLNSLRPLVQSVQFIDQQQAYEIFKEEFKDLPDLVKNTPPDALPESFTVKLSDPAKFAVVRDAVANQPGVDQVQDEHTFLKKLFDIAASARNFAIALAIFVIIAAIVMIGVAVQVSAASRRRETGIMRLVGASNLYIQLPFLLEGMLAGLGGALLGFAFVAATKYFFIDRALRPVLAPLGSLIEWPAVLGTLPYLAGAGVVIAGVASFVTLQMYMVRQRV
ncbi:MAG: permease-like cell division protein FtsX [Acidothermus sp.]|nr:permease-like cell division protein FtsX [Acidothermus sp.]